MLTGAISKRWIDTSYNEMDILTMPPRKIPPPIPPRRGRYTLPNTTDKIPIRFGNDSSNIPTFIYKKPHNVVDGFFWDFIAYDINPKETYTMPKSDETFLKNNAIGIDFGTTRCCVAVNRKKGIETVAIENTGGRLMPSFVSFDEELPKFGEVVVNRLQYKSKSTVFDVKRFIGKSFSFVNQDRNWPFKVTEENSYLLVEILGFNGLMLQETPETVASLLIKHMKQKSEEYQNAILENAVITVPIAFTISQRKSIAKAAELANFKTIHLLPEPVAAAFTYYNNMQIPNNTNILLFDLGGGTLDVCIFKITFDDKLEVITSQGDACLGGRDFDNLLINHFADKLDARYGIIVDRKSNKLFRLMKECLEIKHNLTNSIKDVLNVDGFVCDNEEHIEITRKKFEELSIPLLMRIETIITKTLQSVDFNYSDIKKVLLVGGSSRMPMIKIMLKNKFPSAEHCCTEHPDEVVAIGAAHYAKNLNQESA